MGGYKKYFIKTIKGNYPNSFHEIISETENNYKIISLDTRFAKTSKNSIDKRLDFCAYFLAFVKTLDKKGESYEITRRMFRNSKRIRKAKNQIAEICKKNFRQSSLEPGGQRGF